MRGMASSLDSVTVEMPWVCPRSPFQLIQPCMLFGAVPETQ